MPRRQRRRSTRRVSRQNTRPLTTIIAKRAWSTRSSRQDCQTGERTGNADLCSVIPNVTLKMGVDSIPQDRIGKLTDYRVRDLDSSDGTSARVRVLTSHSDGFGSWGSVGVHQDIIDASWTAVSDGLLIGLMRAKNRTN